MLDSGDVTSLFRFSTSTLWRHVKDNKFPAPIYVGKTALWHKKTLERWLLDQHGLSVAQQENVARKKRDIDGLC